MFKNFTWITAVLLGATALSAAAEDAKAPETQAVEESALVIVNGKALTADGLEKQVAIRMARFEGVPDEARSQVEGQLREQIQEEFITRTILMGEAERRDIVVSSEEIDEMIDQAKENLPEGMSFDDILKIEQLNEEGIREEIRQQLTMQKFIENAVEDEVEATDEEVEAFYNENIDRMKMPETVSARHILIKVDQDADDETRKARSEEAAAIRKQLLDGEDFAELAKAKSSCPSSQKGGDLGQFPRGQMVKPFEDAAFSQDVGEVGDVVETQFGYHIILIDERNEASEQSLDEAREEIEQFLVSRQIGESRQAFLEKLRDAATIEYPATATDE